MDSSQDEVNWFGEGFGGYPRRLPEDCVEYTLFLADFEDKSLGQVRSSLQAIQRAATELQKRLLKGYIWQRDGFTLKYYHELGRSFLKGRTNFGDSVEDEWLIVYILRELSKEFPSLLVRMTDSDGEFLLIEAANALPDWLNPENADNRVWLRNGKIYIIPLESPSQKAEEGPSFPAQLSFEKALDIVQKRKQELYYSASLEEEAFYRLRNYPDQISNNFHSARILVPRNLAYILHERPALISPAVEAFYLRDPISLRPLQAEDDGDLIFRPRDLVTISTKFTKVGFAQVKSQHFPAPATWVDAMPVNDDSRSASHAEIGMKISSGFEMLLRDTLNQDKTSVREIKLLLEELSAGEDVLPSDREISTWDDREDDEDWLDIDFRDFEEELAGKSTTKDEENPDAHATSGNGFGDKTAQENLRKMVERFENFLNDDKAGAEGAQMPDDMDFDDDDDDESDIGSGGEDKELSFNEEEFSRMMREMMGMPPDSHMAKNKSEPLSHKQSSPTGEEALPTIQQQDEHRQIQEIMDGMEAELREAGALELDSAPKSNNARRSLKSEKEQKNGDKRHLDQKLQEELNEDEIDEEDEGVNIDYNLAKNLLESFKSQAGLAGPGGNILGLMGLQLPRDEDEDPSASKNKIT
ncbi:SGT1-domain-containing protein [Xylona heveae TC161]|uniref:SGT1-domain-containing protein n=1 Tax=Xylona heveae (strain CBS 132557 / TC161) TaxID=1328760 RepID=A0A164ZAH7_XYLHT|nr:SGT1-domain-containing protein [Xylona heveae TC161]KZF18869.1 SGT1-domain-containing protein [Xylona heveae TC161]